MATHEPPELREAARILGDAARDLGIAAGERVSLAA
jgi:hypothetical protein